MKRSLDLLFFNHRYTREKQAKKPATKAKDKATQTEPIGLGSARYANVNIILILEYNTLLHKQKRLNNLVFLSLK